LFLNKKSTKYIQLDINKHLSEYLELDVSEIRSFIERVEILADDRVASVACDKNPTMVKKIGIKDVFDELGNPHVLLKKHGLTTVNTVKSLFI
jgi:hypothetical protein